jgi:hypothetical protein
MAPLDEIYLLIPLEMLSRKLLFRSFKALGTSRELPKTAAQPLWSSLASHDGKETCAFLSLDS